VYEVVAVWKDIERDAGWCDHHHVQARQGLPNEWQH